MHLGALCLALLAGSPAVVADDRPLLRVGMDPRSAPWAYVPGREFLPREDVTRPPAGPPVPLEKLVGLDVDVLHALAARLHVRPVIVPTAWRDLEAGLIEGRYDLILCQWTPTPKTPAALVASIPYYEWGLLVAVRASDTRIRSLADLAGNRVGDGEDPAVGPALRAMGVGLGVRLIGNQNESVLFDDLKAGRLDAVVYDSPYVRWRVAADPALRIVGEPLNRLGYHAGVRRGDPLLPRVDVAIQSLAASGELAAIRRRWEEPRP
jgi:ABC-type amino acid transport substrate-binding protein